MAEADLQEVINIAFMDLLCLAEIVQELAEGASERKIRCPPLGWLSWVGR